MKTLSLSAALLLLSIWPCLGQFTLEHSYPNAATPVSNNQFYLVHLETLGDRYVFFDKTAKTLTFFDLNHVQVQFMDMSAAMDPNPGSPGSKQLLYISQFLFDLDPGIEVMLVCGPYMNDPMVTSIIDEDGSVIQAFVNEAPYVMLNAPQAQRPIYNTSEGTKLIMSHQATSEAKVYSLPGTLAENIDAGQIEEVASSDVRVYPDQAGEQITVELSGTTFQEQVLFQVYSASGSIVLSRRIVSSRTDVPIASLAPGSYTYVLFEGRQPLYSGSLVKY